MHPLQAELARRAGKGGMEDRHDRTVYFVDIDYSLAEMMKAQRAAGQRKLNRTVAKTYAHDLLRGAWQNDLSDPIRFDKNMSFVDGQHRIEAVLIAGARAVLQEQFVVVLKRVVDTMALPIDQGKRRSRLDYERSSGITIPSTVSAGLLREHLNFTASANLSNYSKVEQAEMVKNHPCRPALTCITKLSRHPAGVAAGLARILRHTPHTDEVIDYFNHVFDNRHEFRGQHDENIRLLSSWLADLRGVSQSGDNSFNVAAIRVMQTWNNHRRGFVPKILPRIPSDLLPSGVQITP